ncbi:phenylacetic acid degradation protein [Pueribacillus theae]|uniref:Phenylacetic acid degradation protein n=1 Tax=Pueribacillus theae TaxID=2171751 RepID=A0A2U1K740_9BACI|nr:PaaI family thioesterase [Pueribacillus theae]PWA12773.1 phenylacetic acid degradation protein [Pueribacillus theae]
MAFEVDVKKRLSGSNFLNFLGVETEVDEYGKIFMKLYVDDNVLNLNNTLHGGVHATILDSVIGQTVAQEAECPISTVNLNIFYGRPAVKNNWLTASATIVQMGYNIVTAEGTLLNENGELIAKAIGSFKILRSNK